MSPAEHRTGTGHIPAARAVSWGCTCGDAEMWTYAASTPADWAMRLAARRADTHRRTHDHVKET